MTGLLLITALSFGRGADAHVLTPTSREMDMLDEVNFVRTKPQEYIPFIEEYLAYWDYDRDEVAAAKELKNELSKMKPLDSLTWSPDMYHDAWAHGAWMKKANKFEHSDYTWAENLVCGDATVRFAMLNLLIDSDVPGRGHRRNLLSTEYTKFACYEIAGEIDGCPFVFVQEFD